MRHKLAHQKQIGYVGKDASLLQYEHVHSGGCWLCKCFYNCYYYYYHYYYHYYYYYYYYYYYILVAYLHKILGSPGQLALLQSAIVHHMQASLHRFFKKGIGEQHGIGVHMELQVGCMCISAQTEVQLQARTACRAKHASLTMILYYLKCSNKARQTQVQFLTVLL